MYRSIMIGQCEGSDPKPTPAWIAFSIACTGSDIYNNYCVCMTVNFC